MRRTTLHGFACGRDSLPQSASSLEGATTNQNQSKERNPPDEQTSGGLTVLRNPPPSSEGGFGAEQNRTPHNTPKGVLKCALEMR